MSKPTKKEYLGECTRCSKPFRVSGPQNKNVCLVPYATAQKAKERGLCADCAATAFLMSVETMLYGINLNGVKILLDPRIQQQFAEIMIIGAADARPEDIDWERVVANWALPLLDKKRGGKRRCRVR